MNYIYDILTKEFFTYFKCLSNVGLSETIKIT